MNLNLPLLDRLQQYSKCCALNIFSFCVVTVMNISLRWLAVTPEREIALSTSFCTWDAHKCLCAALHWGL